MADYLTPYVEFLGLPGSGKSYYSHKVAEKLRGEGFKIAEPSWELDHNCGKYSRGLKKMMMTLFFTLFHHREAKEIKDVIRTCGYSHSEENRFYRNVLYKAYLLAKRNNYILFFDEAMAQMAASLSVGSDKSAGQIYNKIMSVLSLKQMGYLIRIDCGVETSILNMDKRTTNDSHVEQITGFDAKKEYLNRYKSECESISHPQSFIVSNNQEDREMITNIVSFLKNQIEKQ